MQTDQTPERPAADTPRFHSPTGRRCQTSTHQDLVAASRQLIARGSKSFAGAAQFFDRPTRDSVYLLYAWCRHCDDAIDGQELGFRAVGAETAARTPEQQRARFAALEEATAESLAGRAKDAVFIGLGHVVRQHQIAPRYPFELLSGLRMDVEGRAYHRFEDLLEYCYGVAGTVGIMMAKIMGVRSVPNLQRACDLGIAFQLTNIARDVIADREADRVYLPREWLAAADLTYETMAAPQNRARLAQVVAKLLDAAEPYYASAGAGLPALPLRSAWAVATARSVYRAIGQEVRKAGPRAWERRASVSKTRKLAAVLGGLGAALAAKSLGASPKTICRDRLWTPPALMTTASAFGSIDGPIGARRHGFSLSGPHE